MQVKLFAAIVALTASLSVAAPVQGAFLSPVTLFDFITTMIDCFPLLIKDITRLGFHRWPSLLQQVQREA